MVQLAVIFLSTYADTMPHLHQLHVLKSGSGKVLEVKERGCAHWEETAIHLRFSPGLIATIKKDNDKAGNAFDDMMTQWLNGTKGTRQPVTWRTLLTVLQEINHGVLAGDIKSILPEAIWSKTSAT